MSGQAGSSTSASAMFSLADSPDTDFVPADWAGSFLVLGARLARHADSLDRRQLVVVLSVPRRDFASSLIGAGWTLTRSPGSAVGAPLDVIRSAGPSAWFRAVNVSHVFFGELRELDESVRPATIRYAGRHFKIDGFSAMAPAPAGRGEQRQDRPEGGSVVRYTRAADDWDHRLVASLQDLAIIGVESRIRADIEAVLTKTGDPDGDPLETLLLPRGPRSAAWFSEIYSSAKLDEVPKGFNAVILDGQGAIKFVAEVLSPIVVCLIDRSVADETQVANLANMRRVDGTAVSISEVLRWRPPTGVEVMGFEVTL
jgi:hypothetical protein